MTTVRLEGYLPVRAGGRIVLCAALSTAAAELHVPDGAAALPDGPFRAELLCRAGLTVAATLRRDSGDVYAIEAFEGDGEAALTGHLSGLRKASHLNVVATEDVEAATARAGWDRWRLPHVALPDAHPDELDLSVELLGKRLRAPLMIAGMTGGSRRAGDVNRRLAEVAQELGLALGLGSQRAMLEVPDLAETFAVRDVAPDIFLLGNIGAVQLNLGVGVDDCRRLVDAIGADALAVHLNPLQEMVQPEGDRDWRALLPKIEALCAALEVPVLAKETGCGISGEVAVRLRDAGVAAIDVGGTGGTAWGYIEGFRAASPERQQIGATYRDWGIPTADAVIDCRAALGDDFPIVATGGVRTGLDAALAIALGADVAGMALPFFRAADESLEAAVALGARVVEEIRIATFCAGAETPAALRGSARRAGAGSVAGGEAPAPPASSVRSPASAPPGEVLAGADRRTSRLSGFYKLGHARRLEVLRAAAGLDADDEAIRKLAASEDFALFDGFIENAIGGFALPLGLAANFVVDGREVLVPMAVEETSVVAAASNMARRARETGGFVTDVVEDLMIGQIELRDVPDPDAAAARLRAAESVIVAAANDLDPGLLAHGGGARGVEVRPFPEANVVVVHLLVACADAMGANSVNTMCETVSGALARIAEGEPGLRILSNLADRRVFAATCRIRPDDLATDDLDGPEVARRIVAAARFAELDPYRAATHNKGIMNGVDAVVIATGNDWRAVEAGAHAYAARDGRYRPLSSWRIDDRDGSDGALVGRLEIPLQVGVVGGVTRLHPLARFSLRLMGVTRSQELARILAAVGLAQNLAALRALGTEGIQKGHMRLHQRNLELAKNGDPAP